MRISYCINTASRDPYAAGFKNPHRSVGYASRYSLLKEKVLPAVLAQGFDEVIVAGSFEEGSGYAYVPVLPKYRDRRDALCQREAAARHATGDILIFGHDDHAVAADFGQQLVKYAGYRHGEMPVEFPDWDLLIPQRQHGITKETLANGKNEKEPVYAYMGGHVLVMRRWLWATVPWTTVDTEFWDTSMTRIWKEAGARLVYADDLVHLDMEAAEHEK